MRYLRIRPRPCAHREIFLSLKAPIRPLGNSAQDGARYQPRLHDVRHTFVVNRLTTWYRDGADVQALLPRLSTYLGHVNVAATQVYLTMTPELLRVACARFERYAGLEDNDA